MVTPTAKIIKRVINHDVKPNIDFYIIIDREFIFHAVRKVQYRNTFEEKEHEPPMKIAKIPWSLYDLSNVGTNPDWVFKRTNGNVEEILVLTEIHRMKIEELKIDVSL